MSNTLDRIIVNGVEKGVDAGAPLAEPWNTERERREKTEENRKKAEPVETPFPVPESSGGGGSGALVVNATPDTEHFDPSDPTQYPLILDKTLEEMLSAETTILKVNIAPGAYYVLNEVYREVSCGLGWLAMLDGTPIYAEASSDGASYGVGDAIATADTVAAATAPFVLHGTITDQQAMSGTIAETPTQLDAAISANRRIVFSIQLDQYNTTIADTTIHIDSGSLGQVNGFALVTVNSTPLLASFRVYPADNVTLVFATSLFTLTPVSGS